MPVTLHLVRHAQGLHNLSRQNENLPDPELTDLGKQQCEELRESFPHHGKVALFIASPLRRALSTCLYGFAPSPETPILALPELKEVGDSPCDTGTSPVALESGFSHLLDLERVLEGWNQVPEWVSWEHKLQQVQERADGARLILRKLVHDLGDNDHVVVVTHGAFLHFLTDDYVGVKPKTATAWRNTEFRSYHFSDRGNQDKPVLCETADSWARRNGDAARPDSNEQAAARDFFHDQLHPFLVPGSWLVQDEEKKDSN